MNIEYATSPVWANEANSIVNLIVKFDGIPTDAPFSASPVDPAVHGRDLFARAVAGEFGPISPYSIPVLSSEQIREIAKANRAKAVDAIKVTTQAGNTFDGDEISQGRMARAIIALQAIGTPSVTWVLADNTSIQASAAELSEALALAGAAQAALWVIP